MPNNIPEQFRLSSYSYNLPEERIAQHPTDRRDKSRLMLLHQNNNIEHRTFRNLTDYINADDLLIINNTKVFPARLPGKKETGGKVEVFLLEYPQQQGSNKKFCAKALLKASRRPKIGSRITINDSIFCTVLQQIDAGKVLIELHCDSLEVLTKHLNDNGQIPLPPYITRKSGTSAEDKIRYQTIYAEIPGAVAAPTAGLHFTEDLLTKIKKKGAEVASITLHVGYGTFAPVRQEDIRQHNIHSEYVTISTETVASIQRTKRRGGKIWAVGTTTARALEYGAAKTGEIEAIDEWCDLYIYPGCTFQVVDSIITNFHLPNSSLLFLVSAFCGKNSGREILLNCYQQALAKKYRFFSYGDAMAILGPRS